MEHTVGRSFVGVAGRATARWKALNEPGQRIAMVFRVRHSFGQAYFGKTGHIYMSQACYVSLGMLVDAPPAGQEILGDR